MGQNASDIMEGLCCGECGGFFEEENGFPVLCAECWKEDRRPRNSDGVNSGGFQVSNYPLVKA